MSKLDDMMGGLLVEGMKADNLPVGMRGAAKVGSWCQACKMQFRRLPPTSVNSNHTSTGGPHDTQH